MHELRMRNGNYGLVSGRVQTRSLEVHIVDHCNLRCWSCCSLSPYLPKWCVDPADLERDLRLARRVLAPRYLKLVGGEPLLHPALDECLDVARRSEIAPVVSVTTNGFLLPRASEQFWRLAQALTISLYPRPPLSRETIALIEARAAEHGLPVNWKRQDQFVDMDLDEQREDATITQNIYDDCWLRRRCHIVSKGRLFTCTRPPHFETFYGTEAGFVDDGIELAESSDMAERLLAYLQRPEPLKACSLCQGGSAPNRPHRQMPLALQRHFKRFPFFQFLEAAFTVGAVGLIVAPSMVVDQNQKVCGLAFGLRKTALHEQACLRQGQGGRFF